MDDSKSSHVAAAAYFNWPYQSQTIGQTIRSVKNPDADPPDARLRAACIEMESLFVGYLIKEMRATIEKSGFISGGRAEEIFTGMLDDEQSRKISAAGGIGLSSLLLKQLSDNVTFENDSGSRRNSGADKFKT